MHDISSPYNIILLAAGPSTRLGQPKQLLMYRGKTLLQSAIDTGEEAIQQKPFVVMGAKAGELLSGTDNTSAIFVRNEQWEEGMASSIRYGLKALMKTSPDTRAVIFMVCDQPFVTVSLLRSLIRTYEQTGKKIIASAYNGTVGIPALFDRTFFDDLLQLQGQEGAKKIILQQSGEVASVDFEKGGIDIDTVEDLGFLS